MSKSTMICSTNTNQTVLGSGHRRLLYTTVRSKFLGMIATGPFPLEEHIHC